jgi:hypothetical protein
MPIGQLPPKKHQQDFFRGGSERSSLFPVDNHTGRTEQSFFFFFSHFHLFPFHWYLLMKRALFLCVLLPQNGFSHVTVHRQGDN